MLTILLAALMVLPVAGQSIADLLQKGIYTQETVGDLDAAIKIYRQIVNSASQSRTYAAQAQYRLAQCLLKKGDKAEAAKAFEKLVQDFSEEKELVAKAREQMTSDTKLLPIPWGESELSEFQIKLPNGNVIGTKIFSIAPSATSAQSVIIRNREYMRATPVVWSRVDADRDTMKPIAASFSSPYIGEDKVDYEAAQARMQVKGQEPKVFALDGPMFDNEEWVFWFRRLPVAPGYKTILPIMGPFRGPIKISLNVLGVEDVQVAAGKFHCYKVELPEIRQIFWIGVDGARQVVKMETMGVTIELVSTHRVDSTAPVTYQDAKVGLSVTASPGWIVQPEQSSGKDETNLFLLDPEPKGSVVLWAQAKKTEKSEIARQLRSAVDEHVEKRSKFLTDYKIRPETIQMRQIGGNQALSCVAEFTDDKKEMVEYLTFVRSENTTSSFSAMVESSGLDEFRKRVDPILETLKIK
ncbi:MAG TPA: tetratricopeptide repeat protein [Candidatus Angelobacter sp.]|nr:tetratricopeptide repeat protein [Candidatus Angelobacter sp.]